MGMARALPLGRCAALLGEGRGINPEVTSARGRGRSPGAEANLARDPRAGLGTNPARAPRSRHSQAVGFEDSRNCSLEYPAPGAADHSFRHTAAIQLIGLGEPVAVVQDLLGHAS